ncbi:MAG: ABC transporter ATP-binding protein [Verrucomicrobiae bacterium]|nr:ABC transporter ATP-binding protein [Verrucomicrobiae bacterium]MCP5521948.1 ABC transporter ATP-binding protein [Verrucomicrobiales bacterium]
MTDPTPAIDVQNLVRRFGAVDAVHGLSLSVAPGRCYGLFGRNGAGKTTTIKCLLNLLRPDAGSVRLFGHDPAVDEVAVKSRLSYVPDQVAFYPWHRIRDWFDYLAAFRHEWNHEQERALLKRFDLDEHRRVTTLSRGEKMQVALIGAICPGPELLILDEPTSGLDPLVRREFIRAVIGSFQEWDPERRTVFVSTHLITEFEGLIDEFSVIDRGRTVHTLEADTARARFGRLRARWSDIPGPIALEGALQVRQTGREVEVTADGNLDDLERQLRARGPELLTREALTLEEIFLAIATPREGRA